MEQDRALWSQEGKDQFLELLKNEVDSSWARKPSISPSLVPFSTPAGPSTPIYQKLDNSQSEIRILELSLSEEDTPITCNLITTPMTKTPEYMALSYGWGDVVDTEEIFVNTHPFQARRNLVAALRQIRQFCRVKSDGSKQVCHISYSTPTLPIIGAQKLLQ
jgi:hypothetical protein